jgi:hypothetical protein
MIDDLTISPSPPNSEEQALLHRYLLDRYSAFIGAILAQAHGCRAAEYRWASEGDSRPAWAELGALLNLVDAVTASILPQCAPCGGTGTQFEGPDDKAGHFCETCLGKGELWLDPPGTLEYVEDPAIQPTEPKMRKKGKRKS